MTTIIIHTPSADDWDQHHETVERLEGVVCTLGHEMRVLQDGRLQLTSCETGLHIDLETALNFLRDYANEGFSWQITFRA